MRIAWRAGILSACILILAGMKLFGEDKYHKVEGTPSDEFITVNGYPEYWVDGKPFVQYSSAFFYHRIPRDRWAEELIHLKAMGVNTIDLYTFWNWHEPQEGQLDFDGHTNPQRDLKYLLRLIDLLGLKLTLRPGPFFCSEWRNGGYPDWLLRRPEYHMSEQAILEGRYPDLSALQYDKSDEAEAGWLKNSTHLQYTRQWYKDLLEQAKPLLPEKDGPLLSVQLDDDQAIGRENYNGPNFYKYMDTLRKFAQEATDGSAVPYYINGADMRVNAAPNYDAAAPIWNTGQDYQMSGEGGYSTEYEAAKNRFLTEIDKTQPLFTPNIIEFQAGWLLDEKDTYARPTDPTNTQMALNVMFQSGMKAVNYYPLNDTLVPAGYECQWSNHFYGWEAAVNYNGKETARAVPVRRFGRLLGGMGTLLGSTHFLPDAGLVYPMATFPQAKLTPAETNHVATLLGRLLWSGVYDHYNFEYVDSDYTPAENFQRYRVLLLPNLINSPDDLKRFPRLDRYSEKAQQLVKDYVEAGGTLVVFPSLPQGKIFDELFAPLGVAKTVAGDATITFTGGTPVRALGSHATLTLPKSPSATVKVFAKDARGGVVGGSVAFGKGQVLFFGADFSAWSVPKGMAFTFEGGAQAQGKDYSEEEQKAARLALPALMKEAGVTRKVYSQDAPGTPRELDLYTTELIADRGSLRFEKRSEQEPGYAFVGVTNFSVDQPRRADLYGTDPHTSDLAADSPQRYMHLPSFILPPRQSLLLPLHVPLNTPYWRLAAGLAGEDEVVYATAELSHVTYDGKTLGLQFTAPADGEVVLRLSHRPQGAQVDGQTAAIEKSSGVSGEHVYVLKIPRGEAPDFIRNVSASYPREEVRLAVNPPEPWIAGETLAVRVRVDNPREEPLEGELDFVAERLYKEDNPPLPIMIPPKSSRVFSFPVEIPPDAPAGQTVNLEATLREAELPMTWGWHSQVVIHTPIEFAVTPASTFPLREDQAVPIVHPTLAAISLPGEATFKVRLKNWRNQEAVVHLAADGQGVNVTPPASQVIIPAGGEVTVEERAAPTGNSGLYRFEIRLNSGNYQATEGAAIAAIKAGEAIAYTLDYDRDGFADVILENQRVRMFISPDAGGRSFAFVLKDSNHNAFDSVGGMRDNFTARLEPHDMLNLPDWTRVNWLGLYNRPYSFQIVAAAGEQAKVHLEYSAPDIYPKGIKLERTLALSGDSNAVICATTLTPNEVEKPQAYVQETSVPFKSFDQPSYRQWFGESLKPADFAPGKTVDLPAANTWIGAFNPTAGETFALLDLTPPAKSQLVVEKHSALLRLVYPDLARKGEAYTYRTAFYFGKSNPAELKSTYEKLKTAHD